ncbi:MAG: asparagine synthase C-terminal domain-containing protein [Pseudomonadota bacterium]
MRPRFLALLGCSPDQEAIATAAALRLACPELRQLHAGNGLFVLGTDEGLRLGAHGVLLGRMFRHGDRLPVAAIDSGSAERILASHGQALITGYWGGYIAFLNGADGATVLRAPLGDLPCYHLPYAGGVALASDIGLLAAAGLLRPTIDVAALTRHLAAEDVRRPETCLAGLSELQGGERLHVSCGSGVTETLWTPWTFAARERQIRDREDAVSRVRDAARHCVAASAAGFNRIALKLSGGLDSSIVAACLADAEQPFTCVTLTTENPAGDERDYAVQVASHLGAPLIVRPRHLADVSLDRSEAARLPRPTARSFAQASTRVMHDVALETGADAVMDGGGGDNVFCSLQSVRPVVDCLLDGEPGCFWPSVRSIAELTESGMPKVAWRAWRARWRRRIAMAFPTDLRFLSSSARADAQGALAHPWLTPPPGALPGKAAHISVVMTAQNVVEGFDVEDSLPTLSPLITQPLVEACLQVPSWYWFAQGRNRAIARRGFASLLPREIVERRSKGSPDSFIIEVHDAHRPRIRSMLLDGMLASWGMLDTAQLAQVLDNRGPVTGNEFFRIMRLVDVEAWARGV